MSYGTVVEADAALGYLTEWVAHDEPAKQRELDTAALWLNASYDALDGQPLGSYLDALGTVPDAVVRAEQVAVRHGLSVPLFPEPGTESRGAVTKERRKVDVLETEVTYATPEQQQRSGPLVLIEVDEILRGIALRRGARAPLPVIFAV